jgi:G3E family GTPase
MKNFGEFYNDQIETASTIILSRTDAIAQAKLDTAVALLREHNSAATLVTTPWGELTGAQLLKAMEGKDTAAKNLAEHDHHCCHGHHHHEEHHHHHHDHEDGHCCCGHDHEEHHHHHDHEDGHCCCGHDHGDHHHHHHHADEVFASWGVETTKKFSVEDIQNALTKLDSGEYGMILRAKGIVACADGGWIHFDYVPEEADIRMGSAAIIGKLCVIGSKLNEAAVATLFGV